MTVFDFPEFDQHEHVSFFCDEPSGLRAVVAIHSTAPMGLAGGGCRMQPYDSVAAAVKDALLLSRAMSYKLALTDMPAGGAKAVVLGDPRRDKSEALLRALGRAVDRLGGRYIIAEDVGTTPEDMKVIGEETRYVTGRHQDSGPPTAHGVFAAIRTAALRKLGRADLDGVRVAVQGLGSVGWRLCGELAAAGARLVVTDVHQPAIERVTLETGAVAVEPAAIYDADVDVFAPCALGGVLDDDTIGRLRCSVVAGSANNQLANDRHAERLHQRGILYAPDFVTNAGGVIGAAFEGLGQGASDVDARKAVEATERVGTLLEAVFDRAEQLGCSTHAAAVIMAKEKIAERRASMR